MKLTKAKKEELLADIRQFVSSRDNMILDEWYCTDLDITQYVMGQFIEYMSLNPQPKGKGKQA